jgi:hypothetical protein
MFLPPLKKTFDVLNIQLITLKIQKLLLNKFFCWFICTCSLLKYVQTAILIKKIIVSRIHLQFQQRMQMLVAFDQHGI